MQEVDLPGVTLTLGEPQQVAEGIGHCWFPTLAHFATGEVLLSHGLAADSVANLVYGSQVFVSPDGGETWGPSYQVAQGPAVKIVRAGGSIVGPSFHLFPDPPGQWRSFAGHFLSYEQGGRRYVMEPWTVHVEGLPRDVSPTSHEGKWGRRWMAQICFDSDALEIDGRILTTVYITYQGEMRYALVALVSEDGGRNWRYLSTVGGPDSVPGAKNGPCEAALIQLADGDAMCVMRVGSGKEQLLGRAYSGDGGRTWSTIDRLPAFSVEPSMRRLQNGVIVLSAGRPGIYLWLSTDPRGRSWESFDIVGYHNAVMGEDHHIQPRIPGVSAPDAPDQTTAYTECVEVSPNKLLLTYDRTPFGWKPVLADSDERSRVYVLQIEVTRR